MNKCIIGLLALMVLSAQGQFMPEYEESPINYSDTVVTNFANQLEAKLQAGKLPGYEEAGKELMATLLKELNMPVESQVLVFSKTSLQRDKITRANPRAIYFSDDAYLGWVPGGIFEAVINDPELGQVFYAIDPWKQTVKRDKDCLTCHGGSRTDYWPGVLVRSIYPMADGNPITSAGSFVTGHDSPLKERWGGWYVTGKHGDAHHMGNVIARREGRDAFVDGEEGLNRMGLEDEFDTDLHLRGDSDIVALMVLEHQCEMHNRLSRAMLRTRKWMAYQRRLYESLGEPMPDEPSGTALTVIKGETEDIVEYLLFCGEIRLPYAGIQGAGDFEKGFRRNRIEDSQGRSLKDFDLDSRLFKYRCSYMIYSDAFDLLPKELKRSVYRRLFSLLQAEDLPAKYGHLNRDERAAIVEILRETKPEIGELLGVVQPKVEGE